MRAADRKATRLLARINGNVDDRYADRIDRPTFDARQRAAWDAIEEAGSTVNAEVLRAIRQQLPAPTRAWPRRSSTRCSPAPSEESRP